MVYLVVSIILYSWFLFESGKKHAENKDKIKLVITGKPEQIKKALESINEQNLFK
jgi:hypothetical protein